MKHFITIAFLFLTLSVNAHKINNYKYLYVVEQGDLYDIETKIKEFFSSIGFSILSSTDVEEMDNAEKSYVLTATYACHIVYGAKSTLVLTLTNPRGTIVHSTSGEGITFSAKGDMRKASKEIFANIKKLNYKFTPPEDKGIGKEISVRNLSEDSIKSYLKKGGISAIEGIYKNISNDGDFYRFAILKENGEYYGVIIQTDNAKWNIGDLKIKLNHIEGNTYDAEYYDYAHVRQNCIATITDRILEVITQSYDQTYSYKYLKIYPSKGDEKNTKNVSSSDPIQNMKSCGSGILISNNIVVTNYHVIDNANNIEISLQIDGIYETYKAKVLCVDKTNDLALLCIKDEKEIKLQAPPFTISNNISDVGTSIFTMGYPLSTALGKEVKITDGIISSKTGYQGDIVTYQISAAIQPGNSGGALFDKNGNLVGITNAGVPEAENVGYAIKSSYLLNLIDSAPINIKINTGNQPKTKNLPDMIKQYTPYIAIIKVY
ncbi:MAG: trypsin-like peptidase domain-containing protein [Paludibacteraceae bacterium]|nr:trypsin-like peptidase domain-containing protein [Paludibacteraceae bacterium]